MRILLINPNTSTSVTDLVAAHVRPLLRTNDTIVPVTGRFGASYIATRAAAAIAAHAALDALAEHGHGCDAVYLACFGDPGLLALREIARVPVIGMAEASCLAACERGKRFAIVTGGVLWAPMLTEFVAALGLSDRFAGVRTVIATGDRIARDPDAAIAELTAACNDCARRGADVVILGGAGLAGLVARLQPSVSVPLLCSVDTGMQATIAAAHSKPPAFRGAPAVRTNGLAPPLAGLLSSPQN